MGMDLAELAGWRHHLHQHPETGFGEVETARFVADRLVELGLTVHRGVGGTGVVASLSRGSSERAIGFRADMDALALTEQGAVPYASRNGAMQRAVTTAT